MALSRPSVYGGLTALIIGAYWWSGQEPEIPKRKTVRKTIPVTTEASPSDFLEADYTARFVKPAVQPSARNLFMPLVLPPAATPAPAPTVAAKPEKAPEPPKDTVRIPAKLAEGDANWAFTGFAIANGVKMAVLENSSTKQSGYVKEGDPWKAAFVRRISVERIVLADKDGAEQVILRYSPELEQKLKAPVDPAKTAATKPVDLSSVLRGPIGQNLQIRPIATAPKATAKTTAPSTTAKTPGTKP
jgi:hypothetical protein